jgi:hypothetical protein
LDQDPIPVPRPLPKPGPQPEKPSRRWVPWVIGASLLLMGFAAGWGALALALNRVEGDLPAAGQRPLPPAKVDAAEVVEESPVLTAPAGAQVTVQWVIGNRGTTTWTPLDYRFVPEESTVSPVIALPPGSGTPYIKPGTIVRVQALLTMPATRGPWQPSWQLMGPGGAVPGGRLTVTITPGEGGEP